MLYHGITDDPYYLLNLTSESNLEVHISKIEKIENKSSKDEKRGKK